MDNFSGGVFHYKILCFQWLIVLCLTRADVIDESCSGSVSSVTSIPICSRLSVRDGAHPDELMYMRRRWADGIVMYEISSQFDPKEQEKIRNAMKDISSQSCVRFRSRQKEEKFLFIEKDFGQGCYTETFCDTGRQHMALDPSWCLAHGRILHELMHALGLSHEHQRPDRDDFIEIQWGNIKEDAKPQFYKSSYSSDDIQCYHYDLTSIMHYANWSNYAASDPKKPIILPRTYCPKMGQRIGLNPLDVVKINRLYDCPEGI